MYTVVIDVTARCRFSGPVYRMLLQALRMYGGVNFAFSNIFFYLIPVFVPKSFYTIRVMHQVFATRAPAVRVFSFSYFHLVFHYFYFFLRKPFTHSTSTFLCRAVRTYLESDVRTCIVRV